MTFTITGNDVADAIIAAWILCVLAVIAWYLLGDKPLVEDEDDDY